MRTCVICSHPNRLAIDKALLGNKSIAQISRDFGVPESSLRNHKAQGHISRQLAKAVDIREAREGMDLLHEMESVINRTKAILDKAEEDGLPFVALSAIGQLRSSLELMAKFLYAASERDQLQQAREPLDLTMLCTEDLNHLERIYSIMEKGNPQLTFSELPEHSNYDPAPTFKRRSEFDDVINRGSDLVDQDEEPKRKLTRRVKEVDQVEEIPTKEPPWTPKPGERVEIIDGIPRRPLTREEREAGRMKSGRWRSSPGGGGLLGEE